MVPKIGRSGKSFKGLATYLTHDPKANTEERVEWTHTVNLANDNVPSAVDEMLWTARAAELLKQEAGIRAGGRPTEHPVKHFSLNWAPGEQPSREHMIETAEGFLRHMGWDEHQAIFVAHNDQPRSHLHAIVNAIHPETGLKLDEGFERRRASKWALEYEREHGIFCENRLENSEDREKSPTRETWLIFRDAQRAFEREEIARQDAHADNDLENPEHRNSAEWKFLKSLQREEREGFFLQGKSAFSEIRREAFLETREEFRPRWADYYAALREGGNSDELDSFKSNLLAEQRSSLETRRDEACATLRETRDVAYREILDEQRDARFFLTARQASGLDSSTFLAMLEDRYLRPSGDRGEDYARAAMEAGSRDTDGPQRTPELGTTPFERTGMRSGFDVGANLAGGVASGIGSLAGSLGDAFAGGRAAPRTRQRDSGAPGPSPFERAADETRDRTERERKEAERAYYEEQSERSGE